MKAIHDRNAEKLKEIISQFGLPTLQETWLEHRRQFKENEKLPVGWNEDKKHKQHFSLTPLCPGKIFDWNIPGPHPRSEVNCRCDAVPFLN